MKLKLSKKVFKSILLTIALLYFIVFASELYFGYMNLDNATYTNFAMFFWSFLPDKIVELGSNQIYLQRPFYIVEEGEQDGSEYIYVFYNYGYVSFRSLADIDYDFEKYYFSEISEVAKLDDICAFLYKFETGQDHIYLYYKIFDISPFDPSKGFRFSTDITIAEKKLKILILSFEKDIDFALDLVKKTVYNDPTLEIELVETYLGGDKSW